MSGYRDSERRAELARLLEQGKALRKHGLALLEHPADPAEHLKFRQALKAHRRELATYRAIFGRTRRPQKGTTGFN